MQPVKIMNLFLQSPGGHEFLFFSEASVFLILSTSNTFSNLSYKITSFFGATRRQCRALINSGNRISFCFQFKYKAYWYSGKSNTRKVPGRYCRRILSDGFLDLPQSFLLKFATISTAKQTTTSSFQIVT
jgi:hypothetical protein